MSEIRGKKGFEAPSQEDLDDYLRQSRKSISQMKNGKSPLIFKPKRSLPLRLIGVMILIIISTSLMLGSSILDFNPTSNNNTNETTTTEVTTVTTTMSTTTQMETTQPLDTDTYITNSILNVETLISTMIAPNRSLINPMIVNGTINRSLTITDLELFELVWILNQFDTSSEWWDLGRSLVFETYTLWNKTSYLSENIHFQLLTLRTLLAYSPNPILSNATNLEIYQNRAKQLWRNVTSVYNNETGTMDPNNDTLIEMEDQIIFCQVLAKTSNFPALFNLSHTNQLATQVLETLTVITNSVDGLPKSFEKTLTNLSEIYHSHHQANMILVLDKLKSLLGPYSILETLTNRLNNFLTDVFLRQDWSIASSYNETSDMLSSRKTLRDQIFYIRANILQDKRNFADFSIHMVRSNFGSEDSSYFTSNEDSENQFLTDHVHLLLAFEEFLKLEKPTTEEPTSYEPADGAGNSYEFSIIIMVLLIISFRRKKRKL